MKSLDLEKRVEWSGNRKSIYVTLGASSHSNTRREGNDYYATDPKAVRLLLEVEDFSDRILEPCCGGGHLSKEMERLGKAVVSYDIVDRGYGEIKDFFTVTEWDGDIITNPPYKMAVEFISHALQIVKEGSKVAFFLKLQFLEGKRRKSFFLENPPRRVWVSSGRLICAKNGMFAPEVDGKRVSKEGYISSSAVAYAWFVWVKGFKGHPEIHWFN